MVQNALDRGCDVVAVCREQSVAKLSDFGEQITIHRGTTNDPKVIREAVAGCDGVLTVLVPWGVEQSATGMAQAVLDNAAPAARLVCSSGWHITRDGKDIYAWKLRTFARVFGWIARFLHFADLDDQVEACRRIFASAAKWTVVRGSDLKARLLNSSPYWRMLGSWVDSYSSDFKFGKTAR
jgi:NAD(P)H-binding